MSSLFIYVLYFIIINLFYLYLRYVAYYDDVFFCFGCKEVESSEKLFDFIIVGSGSAGSIVAHRLAQDKNLKILVLEAGAHGTGLTPPAFGLMLQQTIFDWQYETVPQAHSCKALKGRKSKWPMGKIVGGTSKLNNMIYIRNHPSDYKKWFKNQSDFDYKTDIKPYFEKLEHFGTKFNFNEKSIAVTNLPFKTILHDAILEAAKFLGYPITDGLHSEFGFASPKTTILNGERACSSNRLGDYKNIVLRTNSLVTELILMDNYEVTGVKYKYLDEIYRVKARKGVILSAGTIGSPKLLMLSGIGPYHHLNSLKIKTKVDLPVGDNLQDHVTTGFDLVLLNTTLNMDFKRMLYPSTIYNYFINKNGPWTSIGCENIGFCTVHNTEVPDLQFMIMSMGLTSDNGLHLRHLPGITDDIWNNYFQKINQTSITILPVVTHPKSQGTVRLNSKNIEDPPLINPNYLSEKQDVEILLQGIEKLKELLKTPSMQKLGAKLNDLKFPGCERFNFDTTAYWECYVRHLTITAYHPVGTCSLGKVVDYEFRVKSTHKLYVVDGSVISSPPTGNPQAAIMILAEKAADHIKNHYVTREDRSSVLEIITPKTTC